MLLTLSCNHAEESKQEESEFLVSNPIRVDTSINKEYVCQIRASNHIEIRSLERGYLQTYSLLIEVSTRMGLLTKNSDSSCFDSSAWLQPVKKNTEIAKKMIEYFMNVIFKTNNIIKVTERNFQQN